MKRTYLGEEIPKLGFGLMRLPTKGGEVDLETTKKMADRFIEEGFTYFDTAYVYHGGKSEVAAKEAIVRRYPRETFQLATKLPVFSLRQKADMQRFFDTQLNRTGASYFDYYLLHALSVDYLKTMDELGVWEFAQRLKEKGLIRHLGFSFHDRADVLDGILRAHPEAEFVQLQINYADWNDPLIQSAQCYEVARKHNKPVIVMEPVKGGHLAAMHPQIQELFRQANPRFSIASWALRFAASLSGIITVLSGMSDLQQINDNISFMKHPQPLTEGEQAVIAKVVAALKKIPAIPCTACQYCVDDCPQKIDIPGVLESYNNYTLYDNFTTAVGHYRWLTGEGAKASDCVSCGACESRCPQKIKISDWMKEIAGVFER